MLKKLTLLFFLTVLSVSLFSQSFEGTFTFVKHTISDTIYYTYYVKGSKIKINEYNKYKKLNRVFIVGTDDKSIVVIDPEKQMFTNLPNKPQLKLEKPQFEIIKSNNSKIINGYRCYQWRVRNKVQNTEITYWVAKDNFNFFDDYLQSLNSYEKSHSFFLTLNNTAGIMPMLVVERTLLRDEKLRMFVTDIKKEILDDSVFSIPENYISFQPAR